MNVRLSNSTRIVILVGAIALTVTLSWLSIRAAIAAHDSELGTLHGYEKAIQLEPTNARYWYLLGEFLQNDLEQPDVNRAIQSFQVSLSLDPRSPTTWSELASAYELKGDIALARAAFLQAKNVYPSSGDVSWKYGNFLLRQNEVTAGLTELRHAAEADPKLGLQVFLLSRHNEPNLDLILDRVLPPNANTYLEMIWELADEGDNDGALKVWPRLVALHPRLKTREVFYFVGGLLNKQQVIEAKRVWDQAVALMDLPQMEDPPGSLIWDGGFETNVVGGGLAWRIEPYKPVRISYDQEIRHSGKRALRIDISARNYSDFVGVCQSVVAEPNTMYEFSAWLKTRNLAKEGGIFFRLSTPGIQAEKVAATTDVGGTTDWTKVSTLWASPPHPELSQICLARSKDDSQQPATAWVDDVSLLKVYQQ